MAPLNEPAAPEPKALPGPIKPAVRIEPDCTAPPEPPKPLPPPPIQLRILRPPGALPDAEFASTCSRCGHCVEACPADAIRLDPGSPDSPSFAGGLPFILARESPCVVCDELACMPSCPSGALKVTPREQIRMGMAVVDWQRCLRHPSQPDGSHECQVCVAACPFGQAALGIDEQGRIEVRPACTGCGLCERACPTEPTSIWVEPGWERWETQTGA
ncbi:MAG: 4Fe-4S binding protein [Planctomycetota bacterium]|nr:4Fe-4S binding protein [Planctomycetota bacterium]